MKKFRVQDKSKRDGRNIVGTYDTMQDANDAARDYIDENDDVKIFDLAVIEIEVAEPHDNVRSYEDACRVLGVEPQAGDHNGRPTRRMEAGLERHQPG